MLITTEGIVLKQNKIAGNRRMIVLFTKDYGKISAGTSLNERSKGRSALALRPFTYAEYEIYKNRGYYNINGASVRKSFYAIGEDIDRFMAASHVIEYLNLSLEEEQYRPRMFELTIEFLDAVTRATKSSCQTMVYAYIFKTLGMQGIMPELRQCVNCGKPLDQMKRPIRFSVSGGGILCGDCSGEEKADPNALIFEPDFDIVEVIQYMTKSPLETFGRVTLKKNVQRELGRILAEYLDYYLNIDLFGRDLSVPSL